MMRGLGVGGRCLVGCLAVLTALTSSFAPPLILPALAQAAGPTAEPVTIIRIRGRAEVLMPGATRWRGAHEREQIWPGGRIRTGEGSQVILEISRGNVVAVGAKTEVAVDASLVRREREGFARREIRNVTLNVPIGDVTSVLRNLDRDSRYNVRTPIATAGVRGTIFHVRVWEKGAVARTARVPGGAVDDRADASASLGGGGPVASLLVLSAMGQAGGRGSQGGPPAEGPNPEGVASSDVIGTGNEGEGVGNTGPGNQGEGPEWAGNAGGDLGGQGGGGQGGSAAGEEGGGEVQTDVIVIEGSCEVSTPDGGVTEVEAGYSLSITGTPIPGGAPVPGEEVAEGAGATGVAGEEGEATPEPSAMPAPEPISEAEAVMPSVPTATLVPIDDASAALLTDLQASGILVEVSFTAPSFGGGATKGICN